jgi:hypothetical protein
MSDSLTLLLLPYPAIRIHLKHQKNIINIEDSSKHGSRAATLKRKEKI